MKDPRDRSTAQHGKAREPRQLDFAGPKLEEGFRYGPAPLLLHGSYNSAKTVTICLKMLYIADLYPGYRWFVGRKVWDELKKTTMSSFFKFCPRGAWEPHGRRSDSEKILELNNGSSFLWGHLDDPDTLTLVGGLEINGFFLNQAEQLEEEIFTKLLSRLGRWDEVTVPQYLIDAHVAQTNTPWPFIHEETGKFMPPSYALLDANPEHELHWMYPRFDEDDSGHWEKRIMVEHNSPKCPNATANIAGNCKCGRLLVDGKWARPGELISYHDIGYKMIELNAYDNKYATRQSLQEMEAQDETWKRRFLWGKKGIAEGQIHDVRDSSVLQPDQAVLAHIEHNCTLHRSMDHGDSAPTAVGWFAVDGDGNVFCMREYYMPNKLISEHRKNISDLSKFERYSLQLADPAIFAPSMQKKNQRWSVAEEYADCQSQPRDTAIYWERGDNDEFGTRNRISEYLRPSGMWEMVNGVLCEVPRVHPITKEKGFWPRLYFVKKTKDYPNGCDQVIRQLKSQRRMKLGTDNGKPIFADDRDPKIPDHCLHPATSVVTENGHIPIRDLIGTSGWVSGIDGWVWYSACERYRRHTAMVEVEFDDGRKIRSTPDHLFLTINGWVRADQLMDRIVCDIVSQWNPSSSRVQFNRSMGVSTIDAVTISSETASDYTWPSGNTIMERSNLDIMSIIATMIDQTIAPAILNRNHEANISAIMPKESQPIPIPSRRSMLEPEFGIRAQKVEHGIESTPKPHWPRPISAMPDCSARSVESRSWPHVEQSEELDSARMPVSPNGGGSPALMTSSEPAPADVCFMPASTMGVSFAHVRAVTACAPEDSYCLTVEDPTHAFAVESGIIVHNSYDFLRYIMAAQLPLPHGVPKKYSAKSFFGMREMALKYKKRSKIANDAKKEHQRLYG